MDSKYMFCPNCGHKVEKSLKFCTYCGHPLHDDVKPQHNQKPTNSNQRHIANITYTKPQTTNYTNFKKITPKKKLAIGLAVLAIIGISIGWYEKSPGSVNLSSTLPNVSTWHGSKMFDAIATGGNDSDPLDVSFSKNHIDVHDSDSDSDLKPSYSVEGRNLVLTEHSDSDTSDSVKVDLKLSKVQRHAKKLYFKITNISEDDDGQTKNSKSLSNKLNSKPIELSQSNIYKS